MQPSRVVDIDDDGEVRMIVLVVVIDGVVFYDARL